MKRARPLHRDDRRCGGPEHVRDDRLRAGDAGAHRWRPYRVECTGSLPTSEVKRRRARLVLGWGTAREDLRVLPAFASGRLLRACVGTCCGVRGLRACVGILLRACVCILLGGGKPPGKTSGGLVF